MYTSIFTDSEIYSTTRYDAASARASGMKAGSVMTIAFRIGGLNFTAINGGPMYKFSSAVSFVVNCENQEEVDYF